MSLLQCTKPYCTKLLEKKTGSQKGAYSPNAPNFSKFIKLQPLKVEEPILGGEQCSNISNQCINKLVGDCPLVDVLINDIPVSCLIDSGSQVTTITESHYLEHCSFIQKLRDCSRYIKLTAANGLDIPVVGMLVVTVSLCH